MANAGTKMTDEFDEHQMSAHMSDTPPEDNGPGMEWIDRIVQGMSPEELNYAQKSITQALASSSENIDLSTINDEPEPSDNPDEEGDEYA